MKKEQFKRIQSIIATFLGLLMAISIFRDTYVLASVGITIAVTILIFARRRVNEVLTDERVALIQQKASTMTLSIFSVLSAATGLIMVELSFRGYESYGGYGYFLVYLVMGVMTLNSIMTWYYGKQFGD